MKMQNNFLTILCLVLAISCQKVPKGNDSSNNFFPHGIASGDPSTTEVVLWTRLNSLDPSNMEVKWEVSSNDDFSDIISSGSESAKEENDYCVKVITDQLKPGTHYYYRFIHEGSYSTIGRTKTLPENTDRIKIGVINCAKYTGGYYHAFDALSKMDDLDVIIHLGDYIYESGAAVEGESYWPSVQATGRQHDPLHECLSLEDYRTRYAQYHMDTVLQNLHAKFPMIVIWDDHEIAMKPLKKLKDGTMEYGGDWQGRLNNSIKAYHEWLPLRPEPFDDIYRSFQFGDLVNLMMLDARVCCKDDVDKTIESLADTSRHIVGNKQLDWIENEVITNNAKWNIFGNQLLIAEKDMGWNRWPGFPQDRNRLLKFIEENPAKNFVVTTGNAHNPHHYVVFNEDKTDTLFHELLPGSISSGNNAEKAHYDSVIIANEDKRLREADNVLWFHQDSHGFIVLDATPDRLQADWYFVSDIRKKDYELSKPYSLILKPN